MVHDLSKSLSIPMHYANGIGYILHYMLLISHLIIVSLFNKYIKSCQAFYYIHTPVNPLLGELLLTFSKTTFVGDTSKNKLTWG